MRGLQKTKNTADTAAETGNKSRSRYREQLDDGDGVARPNTSSVYALLSNDRRRAVLEKIRGADEAVSARDLSEHIAGDEQDQMPPPRDARRSVYVSLIQTHLPKLADHGVIQYDESSKTVGAGEHLDWVLAYVDRAPNRDQTRQWPRLMRWLLIGLIVGGVATAILLAVMPLHLFVWSIVIGVVSVGLLPVGLTVVHIYRQGHL